jgi:hypothetical protein
MESSGSPRCRLKYNSDKGITKISGEYTRWIQLGNDHVQRHSLTLAVSNLLFLLQSIGYLIIIIVPGSSWKKTLLVHLAV